MINNYVTEPAKMDQVGTQPCFSTLLAHNNLYKGIT